MTNKLSIMFGLILLVSCNQDRRPEIEEAMKSYDSLLLKLDAERIAGTYTIDGQMGNIVGRDSIRKFLMSFVGVKVLEQKSQTRSIIIRGDTAIQEGSYAQKVVVKSDTLNLKGQYQTTWIRDRGKWYIKTMNTQSE